MADDVKITPSTDTSAATIAADDDGSGRLFQLVRTEDDRKILEDCRSLLRSILTVLLQLKDSGPVSLGADLDDNQGAKS